MRRPSDPSTDHSHWSKDFVEHLRTVHFALVAVSVGLLLLLSSHSYDAAVALTQVEEILQLKSLWSPQSLVREFPARIVGLPHPVDEQSHAGQLVLVRTLHSISDITDFEGVVTFSKNATVRERTEIGTRLHFHMDPAAYWCYPVHDSFFVEQSFPFPNRPTKFESWWNDQNRHLSVIVVEYIFGEGRLLSESTPSRTIGTITFSRSSLAPSKTINLNLQLGHENELPCFLSGMSLTGIEPLYVVQFDIGSIRRLELTREMFKKRFPDWKLSGTFEEAFSDLAKAVRGRQNLDWAILERMLSEDASSSHETFEVFGVKFPVEQVTVWGMVVLLGVQLYLFMYLRRLYGRLHADDPGWDIPWIAMDESGLAGFMLFLSLVLLPCCAAALIAARALFQWIPEGWSWHVFSLLKGVSRPIAAQVIVMLLAFCTSVALSILSWRCRPISTEPRKPSQLFE